MHVVDALDLGAVDVDDLLVVQRVAHRELALVQAIAFHRRMLELRPFGARELNEIIGAERQHLALAAVTQHEGVDLRIMRPYRGDQVLHLAQQLAAVVVDLLAQQIGKIAEHRLLAIAADHGLHHECTSSIAVQRTKRDGRPSGYPGLVGGGSRLAEAGNNGPPAARLPLVQGRLAATWSVVHLWVPFSTPILSNGA